MGQNIDIPWVSDYKVEYKCENESHCFQKIPGELYVYWLAEPFTWKILLWVSGKELKKLRPVFQNKKATKVTSAL